MWFRPPLTEHASHEVPVVVEMLKSGTRELLSRGSDMSKVGGRGNLGAGGVAGKPVVC